MRGSGDTKVQGSRVSQSGVGGGKWRSPRKQWMRGDRGSTDKDLTQPECRAGAEAFPRIGTSRAEPRG